MAPIRNLSLDETVVPDDQAPKYQSFGTVRSSYGLLDRQLICESSELRVSTHLPTIPARRNLNLVVLLRGEQLFVVGSVLTVALNKLAVREARQLAAPILKEMSVDEMECIVWIPRAYHGPLYPRIWWAVRPHAWR